MENGNVNEFLDKITYQEEALCYEGKKYFFNPFYYDPKYYPNITEAYGELTIDFWPDDDSLPCATILKIKGKDMLDCLQQFLKARIWDGKTFWEVEKEMTWVDW